MKKKNGKLSHPETQTPLRWRCCHECLMLALENAQEQHRHKQTSKKVNKPVLKTLCGAELSTGNGRQKQREISEDDAGRRRRFNCSQRKRRMTQNISRRLPKTSRGRVTPRTSKHDVLCTKYLLPSPPPSLPLLLLSGNRVGGGEVWHGREGPVISCVFMRSARCH